MAASVSSSTRHEQAWRAYPRFASESASVERAGARGLSNLASEVLEAHASPALGDHLASRSVGDNVLYPRRMAQGHEAEGSFGARHVDEGTGPALDPSSPVATWHARFAASGPLTRSEATAYLLCTSQRIEEDCEVLDGALECPLADECCIEEYHSQPLNWTLHGPQFHDEVMLTYAEGGAEGYPVAGLCEIRRQLSPVEPRLPLSPQEGDSDSLSPLKARLSPLGSSLSPHEVALARSNSVLYRSAARRFTPDHFDEVDQVNAEVSGQMPVLPLGLPSPSSLHSGLWSSPSPASAYRLRRGDSLTASQEAVSSRGLLKSKSLLLARTPLQKDVRTKSPVQEGATDSALRSSPARFFPQGQEVNVQASNQSPSSSWREERSGRGRRHGKLWDQFRRLSSPQVLMSAAASATSSFSKPDRVALRRRARSGLPLRVGGPGSGPFLESSEGPVTRQPLFCKTPEAFLESVGMSTW